MIKKLSTRLNHKYLFQTLLTFSNKRRRSLNFAVSILLLFFFFQLTVLQAYAIVDYSNFEQGHQVLSGGVPGSSDEEIREKLEMKNLSELRWRRQLAWFLHGPRSWFANQFFHPRGYFRGRYQPTEDRAGCRSIQSSRPGPIFRRL